MQGTILSNQKIYTMKLLKYFSLLAMILLSACSSDDDGIATPINETENLTLVQTINANNHEILLYTTTGEIEQGYNEVYLQIKSGDELITNADISWMPIMHMTSKMHSCPNSNVVKSPAKETLYQGYLVFQMASNDDEYWELNFDYSIDGTPFTASDKVYVKPAPKQRVAVFMGSDNQKYVLAMVDPRNPQGAVNDMRAGLFKMEDMMNFTSVNNYHIKIDPRMPSMENHGSPNNQDLYQENGQGFYEGKVNFTMTGYWKINLQVANESGEIIKGEAVTESNEASSLYFEVEF